MNRFAWMGLALALSACAVESSEERGQTAESALTTRVTDVDGLPGTYRRVWWSATEMNSMTLGPMSQAEGSYVRTLGCCSVERGTYHAIPENPAIGWAMIGFRASDGRTASYVIDGLIEDALGRVTMLQLRRLDDRGLGAPFTMVR